MSNAGVTIEADLYCPEHGDQPTAYTGCSCEGRAILNLRRRAERAEQQVAAVRALAKDADASGRHINGYGYVLARELQAIVEANDV